MTERSEEATHQIVLDAPTADVLERFRTHLAREHARDITLLDALRELLRRTSDDDVRRSDVEATS